MTNPVHVVDIAVIGGGTAGLVAARELALAGASVLIVDRTRERLILGEGLPPAAAPTLQALDLWERFLIDHHLASYGNVSTWGTDSQLEADFIRSPYGQGWHVDRGKFDAMMANAACKAGVMYLQKTRAVACTRSRGLKWVLTLTSGSNHSTVHAGFLVDASGRARWVARSQGVRRVSYDRLVGVIGRIATAEHNDDRDTRTVVEAAPDGWWYSAPIPNGELVIGYMTDADLATTARTLYGWTSLIANTISTQVRLKSRAMKFVGPLQVVSSESSCLSQVAGDGWCAVGDAAAAYDPLSSLGLLMALQGGQQAVQSIRSSDPRAASSYQAWVRHTYVQYLTQWLVYYSLEQRWSDHPFWQRRHVVMGPGDKL